jgi:SAM-dependent methyltransferase
MNETSPWYEDDGFWEATAPYLFNQRRLDATHEQVDQVLELLQIEPGAQVLDLCCGPGRHSLELARRGFSVTGVDRTTLYLEQARKQAQIEKLSAEFIQEDMRRFRQPDGFNAAINLYTSFGYFDDPADDRHVLANLFSSLKQDGTLVMEMMSKEVLARIFRERDWWQDEGDGTLFLEERKLTSDWTRVESRWILVRDGTQREFTLTLRLYAASELTVLLEDCGFETVEIYGGLEGEPYDHTAKRLVAVARRAG